MNIQVKLEKDQLECCEGLNHLLIHIDGSDTSEMNNFRLHLALPEGIHAFKNLSSFPENDQHVVAISRICAKTDVIFELFTEGDLPVGQVFLTITLSYALRDRRQSFQTRVPLMIVSEEISHQIAADPEVSSLVAKLINNGKQTEKQYSFVVLPTIQETGYKISPLEKKYRIQGLFEAIQ